FGEGSGAYRDLKFSFIDLLGKKLTYVDLLNYVARLACQESGRREKGDFKSGDIPNLAAAYLTSFLRNNGHRAEYINLFQYEHDKLVEYLAAGPLCIAITTTFYVMNLPVKEMVKFIREHNRSVKLIVGGPLISNHQRICRGASLKAALDDIGADIYIIEGQGELTLSRVIECLKNGDDLGDVPNVCYYDKG